MYLEKKNSNPWNWTEQIIPKSSEFSFLYIIFILFLCAQTLIITQCGEDMTNGISKIIFWYLDY